MHETKLAYINKYKKTSIKTMKEGVRAHIYVINIYMRRVRIALELQIRLELEISTHEKQKIGQGLTETVVADRLLLHPLTLDASACTNLFVL